MTNCCHRHRMRWSGATGAIARCKNRSTGYARRARSVHAWRWICGVKPKPKAVNKPSPHFIVRGLDKPGSFTTVSISPEMAVRLSKAFGTTPETWLRLQMAYDLSQVRQKNIRVKRVPRCALADDLHP